MLNMTMEILGLTIRGMMMVTDEERREVARKFRREADNYCSSCGVKVTPTPL